MASSFSFLLFSPTEIVASLHCYDITPSPNLYVNHVENLRSGFVAKVLQLFLVNILGYACGLPLISPGCGLISAFALLREVAADLQEGQCLSPVDLVSGPHAPRPPPCG
ncbi:hypothetical protein BDA96_08G113000 [Sorghum bicolor]|jgi:hypothetical protein|uniref:Uncharacterized protein n=2 Tax=Sorghum bicolor TaxID=4558 RepID=A0A921U7X4_SORBI|nr:hypothetical protein BDA96_08G113000 [Sorghum bicolor]